MAVDKKSKYKINKHDISVFTNCIYYYYYFVDDDVIYNNFFLLVEIFLS